MLCLLAAMLALAFVVTAFVCPPVEEALPLRKAGEPCGGTCNSYGDCAKGLECHTDSPRTSPMSFAILMGGTKKAGLCREAVEAVEQPTEERRSLQLGGSGMMAGGISPADTDSPEVLAVSKWATSMIQRKSNSLEAPTLTRIVSASKQVCAAALGPRRTSRPSLLVRRRRPDFFSSAPVCRRRSRLSPSFFSVSVRVGDMPAGGRGHQVHTGDGPVRWHRAHAVHC